MRGRGFDCQLSATGTTRAEHWELGWSHRCPGPTTRRWLARAPHRCEKGWGGCGEKGCSRSAAVGESRSRRGTTNGGDGAMLPVRMRHGQPSARHLAAAGSGAGSNVGRRHT